MISEQLDTEVIDFLRLLELLDTSRGFVILEGLAVGFDDLHGDFELRRTPAAALVTLGHLAANKSRAVRVAERDSLVQSEVQV